MSPSIRQKSVVFGALTVILFLCQFIPGILFGVLAWLLSAGKTMPTTLLSGLTDMWWLWLIAPVVAAMVLGIYYLRRDQLSLGKRIAIAFGAWVAYLVPFAVYSVVEGATVGALVMYTFILGNAWTVPITTALIVWRKTLFKPREK